MLLVAKLRLFFTRFSSNRRLVEVHEMCINGVAKSARVAQEKGERKGGEVRWQKSGLFSNAILADLIYVLSSVVFFLFPMRERKRERERERENPSAQPRATRRRSISTNTAPTALETR